MMNTGILRDVHAEEYGMKLGDLAVAAMLKACLSRTGSSSVPGRSLPKSPLRFYCNREVSGAVPNPLWKSGNPIQIFSPGRGASVSDVALDLCGVITGMAVVIAVRMVINCSTIKRDRNENR